MMLQFQPAEGTPISNSLQSGHLWEGMEPFLLCVNDEQWIKWMDEVDGWMEKWLLPEGQKNIYYSIRSICSDPMI